MSVGGTAYFTQRIADELTLGPLAKQLLMFTLIFISAAVLGYIWTKLGKGDQHAR